MAENVAAASITLDDSDREVLDALPPAIGARY